MSDLTSNFTSRVLHIRAECAPGDAARRMDVRLASVSLPVMTCGDVYRGLARLLRTRADHLRAVIVCVDGLGQAEFEFFAIASRLLRGVSVYVYGSERSAVRISQAVGLGATGEVTEEVIRELTWPVPLISGVHTPGESPATRIAPAPPAAMAAEEPTEDVPQPLGYALERPGETASEVIGEKIPTTNGPLDDKDSEEVEESETLTAPVRVPWLQHHDRPIRQAPQGRGRSADEQKNDETASQRSSPNDPLLTEEELHALMGNDPAGLASEKPPPKALEEQENQAEWGERP